MQQLNWKITSKNYILVDCFDKKEGILFIGDVLNIFFDKSDLFCTQRAFLGFCKETGFHK